MIDRSISFFKMSGAGNDFIVIDNRDGSLPVKDIPGFVRGVCRRKMSAGADGLILIENSDETDFKWQFFNSDGSVAEMCGNGARCAARYAHLNGIAGPKMSFETIAGIIHARVNPDTVTVKMTDPVDLKINTTIPLKSGAAVVSIVNTGVPHVVITAADIDAVDVRGLGREIRFHPQFTPEGTNVNFIAPGKDGSYFIRTYERGVEGETLACGTGNVAAAIVIAETLAATSPVSLITRSGSRLRVYFQKDGAVYREMQLEGDARVIYQGEFWDDAWADIH
ncbi:MAG: diaminopimelate epimerase [Desulfobacteraceae bacterium]|nr:diaminopimelate epimerase [Desulfobacteraceae bacterium]